MAWFNSVFYAFKWFWTREKSFTFLLIVLVLYIFGLIPLLTENIFSKIAFLCFYYLLLGSSMPFLLKTNKQLFAACLIFIPFVFLIAEISFSTIWLQALTDLFVVLYCGMLVAIILTRAFDQGKINKRRVQGAIVVYLLLGLIYCLLYHAIYILGAPGSFTGLTGTHRKEFLYFSFCTLTTNGYGDILPVSSFARSLSNGEALVGQLFPAILIARLVSMELTFKKPSS